jgi:Tfp pilus assembly protein PilV
MRPAFTLAEVLAAILLFAVGIVGLASSGTFIAAQVGEARAVTEGAIFAGRILDSLRSRPCMSVVAGQGTHGRATVRWTTSLSSRTVAVDATLELAGRRGPRQWPINALLIC